MEMVVKLLEHRTEKAKGYGTVHKPRGGKQWEGGRVKTEKREVKIDESIPFVLPPLPKPQGMWRPRLTYFGPPPQHTHFVPCDVPKKGK
jgi:hypothetical protein